MLAALAATPAFAQDACSFFEGKTVELVVPFDPGGGFDAYGRLVAKYMADELGAENMIVRNQPGAGGLLATNQTWTAEPDGLLVQVMSTSGMLTAELGGAEGVQFKTGEFSWIGRISGEPDALAVGPDSGIETVDDIKKLASERQVRIGSSGVGDIDYIEAQLLSKVFDLDANIVTGFAGAPEVYASLARGEVDFFTSSLSAVRKAEKAESADALWLFSSEADESAPDLKPLSDFIDEEYLPLVKAHSDLIMAGRALAGPPGIAEDRLQCLRDAFDRTMQSPELLAESEQLRRPVAPIDGERMASMIGGLTSNPPEAYVELLRSSYSN
jgi:tripartite-type tricarboxylate transporter receptor subunit TctC